MTHSIKLVGLGMNEEEKKRTALQNKSMHRWFALLANSLNDAGYDAREVLEPEVEIPITDKIVKNQMLKKIAKAMYDKDSTTELTTIELSECCKVLSKHTSEVFGVYVPFPSYHNQGE